MEISGTHGLTLAEVAARRRQYGENALPVAKATSPWAILFAQFKSPLVYIILAAALISLVMGEWGDFAIIMAVVVIDAVLGFVQEYQAQRTYTALKGLLKPTTTVVREGQRQEIEVKELVPGDIVLLTSGDRVPADGNLTQSYKVSVDEAILTGESEPVSKGNGHKGNGANGAHEASAAAGLYGHDCGHRAWRDGGDEHWLAHRAGQDRHQPARIRRTGHAAASALARIRPVAHQARAAGHSWASL